jgi:hypothetical protein
MAKKGSMKKGGLGVNPNSSSTLMSCGKPWNCIEHRFPHLDSGVGGQESRDLIYLAHHCFPSI